MEQIRLPWPASKLFEQSWETLKPWLDEVCEPSSAWFIGGGSVLAARWKHRQSEDLDIFLDENSSLGRIRPVYDRTFADAMHKAGAREVRDDERSLKFTFDAGRIEITQLNPRIGYGQALALVENQPIWTMSNAQILAGKLIGRGLRTPERDLFDLGAAWMCDRRALERAVNAMEPNMRREVIARIVEGKDRYQEQAPEMIMNPADRFMYLMHKAPGICADALSRLGPKRIVVRQVGNEIELVKVFGDESESITKLQHGRIREQLEESGLGRLRLQEEILERMEQQEEDASGRKEVILEGVREYRDREHDEEALRRLRKAGETAIGPKTGQDASGQWANKVDKREETNGAPRTKETRRGKGIGC